MTGTLARDVVIVGGGHNGLAAAAYLAQAGLTVTVLERLDEVGGAAVSEEAFAGVGARLSRYSYLVSLLPRRIVEDLRLDIRLVRRRFSSYTPRPGTSRGILIDKASPDGNATALGDDARGWRELYGATSVLAERLFPTVTSPLLTAAEARRAIGDEHVWRRFVEEPVGLAISEALSDDVVRGIALTDALIGTFAPDVDPSFAANRCFLYHVIGGGTGEWDVPVGGMGAVTAELRRAAVRAGAELRTGVEATGITPDGDVTAARSGGPSSRRSVSERRETQGRAAAEGAGAPDELRFHARWVLAGCSPAELSRLLGEPAAEPAPEGSQVKVNLLLARLPRLRDPLVDARQAFGGTFHVNETWTQLQTAYDAAAGGAIPEPLPLEIYSHSLADPSILSEELQASGAQTITVFGLHTPHRLSASAGDPDAYRARLERAVIDSLDSVLAEPIEALLLTDADGRPTIETKTTADLEATLRLPGGNIFHGPLDWPWAADDEDLSTPAARWGVATRHERILLAGSGARRGGAVSAIAGHNAAMAVLESL